MQPLHKKEEILISHYRAGFVYDEYDTVIRIYAQNKTFIIRLKAGLNIDEFIYIKQKIIPSLRVTF